MNSHGSQNVVKELTARDTDSNATDNFTLTYDAAGNLSDDGEHYEYEYDAFYRLRKVKNTSTQALVAEYRYNALNHRIGVHEDSDTDGDVDSNDKWYYDAFDERWRLLARFRESDTAPKEDFVPHQAGDSGHGTSSYIDLVICRNRDADTAWTAASDGTLEERNYLLQNWRADVSAVVSGNGLLKEWVKYSSYGIPIGLPGGDTDSDGDCDANDITQVQTWITASAYDVRGDVDLDGDVDASDKSELQTNYQGITLGRGVLSSSATASRKGYAGYEGLTNLADSQWLARNRVLMAELGRWGRRDPLGYVDGSNLYGGLAASPIAFLDPHGEACLGVGFGCGPGISLAVASASGHSAKPMRANNTCPPSEGAPYPLTPPSPEFCGLAYGDHEVTETLCADGTGTHGANYRECLPSIFMPHSYLQEYAIEPCTLCVTITQKPSCLCSKTPNNRRTNCQRSCMACEQSKHPSTPVTAADDIECKKKCEKQEGSWTNLDCLMVGMAFIECNLRFSISIRCWGFIDIPVYGSWTSGG